jgi:glutathione S-transferase
MAAPAAACGHGPVTSLWISLSRARLGLGRAQAYVGSIEEPHMSEPVEIFFWPTPNGVKISPNTRMPAITDPEGPDGKPISIFESGAILQYLGRKSGKCYGPSERERIGADQWVHWQVANLGPVSGQYNHFRNYARTLGGDPDQLKYAVDRFGNELNKLHGVMETVLAERDYIATGAFSIADIACWGWMRGAAAREEWAKEFPRTKAWFDRVAGRPGVQRGVDAGKVVRQTPPEQMTPEEQAQRQKMLFGQTAKSVADAASAAKS